MNMILAAAIPSLAASAASTSLTTLGTVFTQIIAWVLEFAGTISTEPLFLVGLAIVVAGLIIGLAFRAVRGKGRGRS